MLCFHLPRKRSLEVCGWVTDYMDNFFSSVQFSSVTQSCSTLCDPWTSAHQASLSITSSQSLLKLMSTESVVLSNHLILCHALLLLPSIFPSIRVFSNESVLHIRWLKYWSFSFNISPSNEHSGLISFRMDWLDLLADQGTLKSLLQHHSSKLSTLQHSTFFIVQFLLDTNKWEQSQGLSAPKILNMGAWKIYTCMTLKCQCWFHKIRWVGVQKRWLHGILR